MQRSDLGALVDYVWTNIKAAAQTVVEAGWVKHFVASCLVGAGVLAYLAAEHPSYALNVTLAVEATGCSLGGGSAKETG